MSSSPTTIDFFVPGVPKPQPRTRARAWGKHARVYDPGTANDWKSLIALAAEKHVPDEPMAGPIRVDLTFCMPRPKSHYRTGKYQGMLRATAPHWHAGGGRCDRDNLDKAVLDVLTDIGFWVDDSQVCAGEIQKVFVSDDAPRPGCAITVADLAASEYADKE